MSFARAAFADQQHRFRSDRKSTRLNSKSHSDLVCRLLLEKKSGGKADEVSGIARWELVARGAARRRPLWGVADHAEDVEVAGRGTSAHGVVARPLVALRT